MPITSNKSDGKLIIGIEGRFDFSDHNTFRDVYKNAPPNTRFEINMSRCDFLDSSALGMLLLLREHAQGSTSTITLTECGPDVKSILEIANFDTLFTID